MIKKFSKKFLTFTFLLFSISIIAINSQISTNENENEFNLDHEKLLNKKQKYILVSGNSIGILPDYEPEDSNNKEEKEKNYHFFVTNKSNSEFLSKMQNKNYYNKIKRIINKIFPDIIIHKEKIEIKKEGFYYIATTKISLKGPFKYLKEIEEKIKDLYYIKVIGWEITEESKPSDLKGKLNNIEENREYKKILENLIFLAIIKAERKIIKQSKNQGFTVKDVYNSYLDKNIFQHQGKNILEVTVHIIYIVEFFEEYEEKEKSEEIPDEDIDEDPLDILGHKAVEIKNIKDKESEEIPLEIKIKGKEGDFETMRKKAYEMIKKTK